nr:hypothetical protein [Tanacetum cinerariifolium]
MNTFFAKDECDRSKMSFHQALDLILKLDKMTFGCNRYILRKRDFLERLSKIPWVVPTFVFIEGEAPLASPAPRAMPWSLQRLEEEVHRVRESVAEQRECRKPKKVKDFAYHKEKMLLCKQAEQGVPHQAEQYDWLADTDEEINEQELEAHYSYMAKIQEVPTADSGTNSEPLEQDDSNVIPDSPDMCDDNIQNDQNDVESVLRLLI